MKNVNLFVPGEILNPIRFVGFSLRDTSFIVRLDIGPVDARRGFFFVQEKWSFSSLADTFEKPYGHL